MSSSTKREYHKILSFEMSNRQVAELILYNPRLQELCTKREFLREYFGWDKKGGVTHKELQDMLRFCSNYIDSRFNMTPLLADKQITTAAEWINHHREAHWLKNQCEYFGQLYDENTILATFSINYGTIIDIEDPNNTTRVDKDKLLQVDMKPEWSRYEYLGPTIICVPTWFLLYRLHMAGHKPTFKHQHFVTTY